MTKVLTNLNILITGGAGFIGSNLANSLYTDNYNVSVLDNLEPQIHGENQFESYTFKSLNKNIIKHHSDIRDINDISDKLIGNDVIVHLAAETGTGQSMYKVMKYFDVNVRGTINLFESIRKSKAKVKKFILSSSRSVYGEGKYLCKIHGFVYPVTRDYYNIMKDGFECVCPMCHNQIKCISTDESSETRPISFYALTKLMQEEIVKYYCGFLKIPYIIFRMQNVYGEGQSLSNPYTGIISIFASLLIDNKNIEIFEDGKESRDFIYIKDVVKAYKSAICRNDIYDKIINLGTGKRTSVLSLTLLLKRLISSKSNINITKFYRIGDIRHNFADITKAEHYLDFKPDYKLVKGLRLFLDWAKMQHHKKINYEESINVLKQENLLIKPFYESIS